MSNGNEAIKNDKNATKWYNMCLKLLCFGRKSSIFDGKMTPEMCLTSSCSRQKHHLKMCRKNGGFTGFPTVKKSEDLFFKKREKGKEDERRLKTPPKKKKHLGPSKHLFSCCPYWWTYLSQPALSSQKSWEQIQWVCRNGHSWRDGDFCVAQLPKSASPSGHLLQFANWKPVRKPWPSSFDGLPNLFQDVEFRSFANSWLASFPACQMVIFHFAQRPSPATVAPGAWSRLIGPRWPAETHSSPNSSCGTPGINSSNPEKRLCFWLERSGSKVLGS